MAKSPHWKATCCTIPTARSCKQQYARMMAEHDFARGRRATVGKLLLAPAWRFFRGYALKAGFRDGWPGLIESFVSANYVRQKTIMLWLLQNGQPVATPKRTDTAEARVASPDNNA